MIDTTNWSTKDMVKVILENNSDDKFHIIAETLTRMGVASGYKLYQTCHILYKKKNYYIAHFKELYALDGNCNEISEECIARRNLICYLLQEWGLLKVDDEDKIKNRIKKEFLKVVPYKESIEWTLIPKYTIGYRR